MYQMDTDVQPKFQERTRNETRHVEIMTSFDSNTLKEDKTMCLTPVAPVAPVSPLEMSLSTEYNYTFLRTNKKEESNKNEALHTLFVNNQGEHKSCPFLIPPLYNDLLCSGEGNITPRSNNKTERLYIPLLNNNFEKQTNMSLIPSFKQLLRVDFQTTRRRKPFDHVKRKRNYVDNENAGYLCTRLSSNQNKKMKTHKISPSPKHFRFDIF
mmetsp:Transcript_23574/g.53799  ORF Transcript_23574/g.53799 Transcript_23574/m.53799 type:complete len:211 (-) Transcript_23574:123-755(-)